MKIIFCAEHLFLSIGVFFQNLLWMQNLFFNFFCFHVKTFYKIQAESVWLVVDLRLRGFVTLTHSCQLWVYWSCWCWEMSLQFRIWNFLYFTREPQFWFSCHANDQGDDFFSVGEVKKNWWSSYPEQLPTSLVWDWVYFLKVCWLDGAKCQSKLMLCCFLFEHNTFI